MRRIEQQSNYMKQTPRAFGFWFAPLGTRWWQGPLGSADGASGTQPAGLGF